MPKDYKHVLNKNAVETSGNSIAPFFAGVCAGLLVTTIVIFQFIKTELVEPVTEEEEVVTLEPEEEKVSLAKLVEQDQIEEPTYEFYKILPDLEINVSEWDETISPVEKTNPTITEPGVYVLQVGSFRKLEAADEVKAKLALLGINADIQRVVINGQDVFHRVRVGPYNTPDKLEAAQSRLIDNDLNFKLLKLTVDQE